MKLIILIIPLFSCFSNSFDHFIDDIAPRKIDSAYRYDKRVTDSYEKELAKWVEYHKQQPAFPIDVLIVTLVQVAQEEKMHFLQDADKTPFILIPLELCKILWDEGNVRYGSLLKDALLFKSIDFNETSLSNSIDTKILQIAVKIYWLRNSFSSNKSGREDLQKAESFLCKIHGVYPLLEKKLAAEIQKLKS